MTIWAIGDLHLSFGTPGKNMDVFGAHWLDHPAQIEKHWRASISPQDLVLLPGDISWAKHLDSALPDLLWIDSLPGTKVMIRGNHDYWWSSINKLRAALPPSIHALQHDSFTWGGYSIGGARLWDNLAFSFGPYIPMVKNPVGNTTEAEDPNETEHILERELIRLEMSLKSMDPSKTKIIMTHYPPLSADLQPSQASALFERYNVSTCVFGHLHGVHTNLPIFGEKNNVRYILAAADYIHFTPIKIS